MVLLHGYGSNGDDLLSLADLWAGSLPATEFLSPNAPERNPFLGQGYQWFGLEEISPFNIRQGLDKAGPKLAEYLQQQLHGLNLTQKDLVLVGFSQGAMMALEMMFLLPDIAGIVGYSGAFVPPVPSNIKDITADVLLVHGTADTVVPYAAFLEAKKQLENIKVNVQTLTCQGVGHFIDPNGLDAGRDFIKHLYGRIDEIIYL